MILRKLLLAACFVTMFIGVSAQPLVHTCPVPVTDTLMKTWRVTEGDWTAIWSNNDPSPTNLSTGGRAANYLGAWEKPAGAGHSPERVRGTMTIVITGNSVVVDRFETPNRGNTCHYSGTMNAAGTTVSGTYSCNYNFRSTVGLPWSARIITPITSRYCLGNEPRLAAPWHEQEGEWHGEWILAGTPGHYNATFVKGRETTRATMTIDITTDPFLNRVVVKGRRTQTLGTCNYEGDLKNDYGAAYPDGWKVSGTYQCSWGGGKLPWSAVIGEGHP